MEGVSPFLSYLIVSARTQNLSVPVDLLVYRAGVAQKQFKNVFSLLACKNHI